MWDAYFNVYNSHIVNKRVMDNLTSKERSMTMAAVRSTGTALERKFIKPLMARRIGSLEFHVDDLVGSPDIVHREARLVVFIDSCFWHGCNRHLRMPQSNRDYWKKKISRNKRRDRYVTRQLEIQDWLVKRIWGHSIKNQRTRRWWLTRIETLINERSGN